MAIGDLSECYPATPFIGKHGHSMDALLKKPLKFAHRGGAGPESANTIGAFELSLAYDGVGLETDSWRDADGAIVLTHDARLAHGWRRRIAAPRVEQHTLALHRRYHPKLASLDDLVALIASCRADNPARQTIDVSIDVKEESLDAAVALVSQWDAAMVRHQVATTAAKLWVCLSDFDVCAAAVSALSSLKISQQVGFVHSTRLAALPAGPEKHAAALAAAHIDACNFYCSDWTTGLTTLYHRFGVYCFSWGCDVERTIVESLIHGCDAIYSDDVAVMKACYVEVFR